MIAQPVSGLSNHLGYWLRFVSNHVSHAFARKLDGAGVTVAEWVVMRELYDVDAMAPSRLAGKIGMTRGAVSKISDKLEAKGLARRGLDATDGRAQILSLTPKGRGLIPALATLADQNDTEFFDHLTGPERATLEQILKDIIDRRGLTAVPVD